LLEILFVTLLVVVYSWTLFNLPVLIVGIRKSRRREKDTGRSVERAAFLDDFPKFSVIVPAKDEERVLPRLLDSLFSQSYPKDKVEVIVVEDGSTDHTLEICERYVRDGRLRLIHAEESHGKPLALNRALEVATGEIVGVFDADSIPEQDVLLNAAKHFQDVSVAALQGRTLTVNSETNMLTKFVSYEEAVWNEGYLQGKEALNLFVHLRGSCQFIRRSLLEKLGGWSERHLSEDMEISARLTEKGYKIKYASDVCSWQETPATIGQMFRQRIRWFRGSMEVALKYGRLIRKPSLKTLDAEATLFAPFVLILSLLSYVLSPLAISELSGSAFFVLTLLGWSSLTATVVIAALALVYVAKPKKTRDLLWAPFIYAYWSIQVFLATWALAKILVKAPKEWIKTSKTGVITGKQARLPLSSEAAQEGTAIEDSGALMT
jgi:cellulose synthase/poly-beta-1,6-N-acetylglucosamine synthase-like glycosyltransferase